MLGNFFQLLSSVHYFDQVSMCVADHHDDGDAVRSPSPPTPTWLPRHNLLFWTIPHLHGNA